MTLEQWIFEIGIDNPWVGKHWQLPHILTLVICVALILGIYFLVKFIKEEKKEKTKKIILWTLTSTILLFEILMRIVYFIRLYHYHDPLMNGLDWFWILIPKPWCAIACWALAASPYINKKFFYNYACITALLCSAIFFVWPGAGFNSQYLLFSNWYSIITHSLLLVTSISLMTMKITEFKYKEFWKFGIALLLTVGYAFLEIYVFKVEQYSDPLYFMPNSDIQNLFGLPYPVFLTCYIAFVLIFVNTFYLIGDRKNIFKKKQLTS